MNPIDQAAKALRQGELVIFPTETVYGLGANALDATAIKKIYAVKGRPSTSPLIVHVPDVPSAQAWCTDWPPSAQKLADRFWPGPLTLVLPKNNAIVDEATAGLKTVGLRVPAHPIAIELLQKAKVPVAAPSANPFTELSPTHVDHVRKTFEGKVKWILDGGPSTIGIESTVLSLVGGRAVLLRPGMISRHQIQAVIGPIEISNENDPRVSHSSPGRHQTHYQPQTPVFMFEPNAPLTFPGRGLALTLHQSRADLPERPMPVDPPSYARLLYSTLHDLDNEKWDWIAIEWPPETGEWSGVRDRLSRAAEKKF